jgi:hypothetical protein
MNQKRASTPFDIPMTSHPVNVRAMAEPVPADPNNPLNFAPSPEIVDARALARYQRLVQAKEEGANIPDAEIERYREAAYGKVDPVPGPTPENPPGCVMP